MRNDAGEALENWKKFFLATAGAAVVVVGMFATSQLRAQAPASESSTAVEDQPKFEVASVKANKSGDQRIALLLQPGGRFTVTNMSLDLIIANAYAPLLRLETIGWPDWIYSARYDIEAKAEGNPSRDQMFAMLRSLLADRFKLVIHREIRQLPVYALVLAKPGKLGPQLHEHTDDTKCYDPSTGPRTLPPIEAVQSGAAPLPMPNCGGFIAVPHRLAAQRVTMEQFARGLVGGTVDRMVLDRTGLSGTYDLTLEFTPQPANQPGLPAPPTAPADPSAPPLIFTAIQEQLGLKLEPQTGPVNTLIIDRVEEPSAN